MLCAKKLVALSLFACSVTAISADSDSYSFTELFCDSPPVDPIDAIYTAAPNVFPVDLNVRIDRRVDIVVRSGFSANADGTGTPPDLNLISLSDSSVYAKGFSVGSVSTTCRLLDTDPNPTEVTLQPEGIGDFIGSFSRRARVTSLLAPGSDPYMLSAVNGGSAKGVGGVFALTARGTMRNQPLFSGNQNIQDFHALQECADLGGFFNHVGGTQERIDNQDRFASSSIAGFAPVYNIPTTRSDPSQPDIFYVTEFDVDVFELILDNTPPLPVFATDELIVSGSYSMDTDSADAISYTGTSDANTYFIEYVTNNNNNIEFYQGVVLVDCGGVTLGGFLQEGVFRLPVEEIVGSRFSASFDAVCKPTSSLDVDGDGVVDCNDVRAFRDELQDNSFEPFANQPALQDALDLNGDGVIDNRDLALFETAYGSVYVVGDVDRNCVIDFCDIGFLRDLIDADADGIIMPAEPGFDTWYDFNNDGQIDSTDVGDAATVGSLAYIIRQAGGFLNGDANGDFFVNVDDFITVLLNFGNNPGDPDAGDANRDGVVNIDDFIAVLLNFGFTQLCD